MRLKYLKTQKTCAFRIVSLRIINDLTYTIGGMRVGSDRKLSRATLFLCASVAFHAYTSPSTQHNSHNGGLQQAHHLQWGQALVSTVFIGQPL